VPTGWRIDFPAIAAGGPASEITFERHDAAGCRRIRTSRWGAFLKKSSGNAHDSSVDPLRPAAYT